MFVLRVVGCLFVLGLFVGWAVLSVLVVVTSFVFRLGVWNCFVLVEFNCCVFCLVLELGWVGCWLLGFVLLFGFWCLGLLFGLGVVGVVF